MPIDSISPTIFRNTLYVLAYASEGEARHGQEPRRLSGRHGQPAEGEGQHERRAALRDAGPLRPRPADRVLRPRCRHVLRGGRLDGRGPPAVEALRARPRFRDQGQPRRGVHVSDAALRTGRPHLRVRLQPGRVHGPCAHRHAQGDRAAAARSGEPRPVRRVGLRQEQDVHRGRLGATPPFRGHVQHQGGGQDRHPGRVPGHVGLREGGRHPALEPALAAHPPGPGHPPGPARGLHRREAHALPRVPDHSGRAADTAGQRRAGVVRGSPLGRRRHLRGRPPSRHRRPQVGRGRRPGPRRQGPAAEARGVPARGDGRPRVRAGQGAPDGLGLGPADLPAPSAASARPGARECPRPRRRVPGLRITHPERRPTWADEDWLTARG